MEAASRPQDAGRTGAVVVPLAVRARHALLAPLAVRGRAAALALLAAALAACCPPAVSSSAAAPPAAAGAPTRGAASVKVQERTYAQRFESAWRLVDERYWDLDRLGVDWVEVGERYRARLGEVETDDDLYDLLEAMYREIGDQHSVYVRPERVDEVRRTYGDLPCLALLDLEASRPGAGLALALPAAGLAQAGDGVVTDRIGPIGFGVTAAGDRRVGYLRVRDLASDGVAEGGRQATARLARQGADALVLDLRGNPGGRLVTMMQVAGVFTSGFLWRAVLSWSLPIPYPAVGEPVTDLPLYVLVDRDVNSAAEGLAGALQDAGRATVVGERTAGNVEAVLPFCLRDGSQAWIATGVLAPLLGATWEGRGVEPDVAVPPETALDAVLELVREGR